MIKGSERECEIETINRRRLGANKFNGWNVPQQKCPRVYGNGVAWVCLFFFVFFFFLRNIYLLRSSKRIKKVMKNAYNLYFCFSSPTIHARTTWTKYALYLLNIFAWNCTAINWYGLDINASNFIAPKINSTEIIT